MTSKIQVDFQSNTYLEVLVIVSCRFLKFLHYLMFLRSANPLMTFLLSYHVWETSKIQFTFRFFRFRRFSRLPKHSFHDKKNSKFISSRAKVDGRSRDQHFIVNFTVMSRDVMSCHVMERHVTSWQVMSRHATPCRVMSRHVTSCHVMSRHGKSCHVMSCHVMSRHATPRLATSFHVMSRHFTSKVAGRSHDQRFIANWLFFTRN